MNHQDDAGLALPVRADDQAEIETQVLRDKFADAMTPGFEAEFAPDEAERVGAFLEDALSEHDAIGSSDDLAGIDAAPEPAFLDGDQPSTELPPFINTTTARQLFGLRSGETVAEAAARKSTEA